MLNGKVSGSRSLTLALSVLGFNFALQALAAPPGPADTAGSNESIPSEIKIAAETTKTSTKGAADDDASVADSATTQAQLTHIFSDVKKLVQQYYPQSKIEIANTHMHFEQQCKMTEESGQLELSPQDRGILCDMTLKDGKYQGIQPLETQLSFNTRLILAPYSVHANQHLFVRMLYPGAASLNFKQKFEKDVNTFMDSQSEAHAASSTPAATNDQHASDSANKGEKPATDEETKELSMVKYTIPEGRFSILLPDKYASSEIQEMGAPGMQYTCTVPNGTYDVSYAVLTHVIENSKLADFFDNFSADLIRQVGATSSTQSPLTLKYYPGRQINVTAIKGKPSGAIIQFYLIGSYIYVLRAIGDKTWLQSAAVNKFLKGFAY